MDVSLATKLAFLQRGSAYSPPVSRVDVFETHMSFVFAAGAVVYKLKKPTHLAFLDFSTLARREAACRAEFALNRALAPQVYLGVVPLTCGEQGLAIDGSGPPVDWLVVMRRLDHAAMLDRLIAGGEVARGRLDSFADHLAGFYMQAPRAALSPRSHRREWQLRLVENRQVLRRRSLQLDAAQVALIDRAQERFLVEGSDLLAQRVIGERIVDGHGDLRAEHVWLGEPVAVIDRLEFSRRLRLVDPFDELAGLAVECAVLGGAWVGDYVMDRVARRLRDKVSPPLLAFYRSYRAALRARLALAHLLNPDGRPLDRWRALAGRYLVSAAADANVVLAFLGQRRRLARGPAVAVPF
jgi:aminoglycoside phosphotransferase family enzyme